MATLNGDALCRKIHRLLSDTDLEVAKRSADFGVVEYTPGESMDLLIEKADKLMCAAKAGGRNRVYPV